MSPSIDDLVIAFVVGNETHAIVGHDLLYLGITLFYERLFLGGDDNVAQVERQTTTERHQITEVLDIVEELSRASHTTYLDNTADDVAQ